MFLGVLKAVGKKLFNADVTCDVIDQSTEPMLDGNIHHHVTFRVTIIEQSAATIAKTSTGNETQTQDVSCVPLLMDTETFITPSQFCELFPFHIIFDRTLTIKQCGLNIYKITHMRSHVGKKMNDVFQLIKPRMSFTYDHILRFINANFIMQLNDWGPNKDVKGNEVISAKNSAALKGKDKGMTFQ